MKKIINLTPHTVNIINYGDIKSSGTIRAVYSSEQVSTLNGIPIYKTSLTKPIMSPEYKEDTIYIVSDIVCYIYPERNDFYMVAETLKSPNGYTIGCKGLTQNPYMITS